MHGKKIKEYMKEYVDENNLTSNIFLNFDAEVIPFDKKCKIKNKKNGEFCDILFDYVIYTGSNTTRNIPEILFKSTKYSEKIIYPDMLTKKVLEKLNDKRVIIYGGSKSAMDMAYTLKKNTSADILLISRGFSSFRRSSKKTSIPIKDLLHSGINSILKTLKLVK